MYKFHSRHVDLVRSIQQQCLAKNLGGIKGLSTVFRFLDRDYSSSLSLQEFISGMRRFGIEMDDEELREVFRYFDKDNSGTIDFREFLSELRPPLPECRRKVISEAFNKLDVIRDGLLKVEDLKIVYHTNAMRHPKYVSGEWTLDDVLTSFIETFDDPSNQDGCVTPEEFLNYYAGVSSIIAEDEYFDLMMRAAWGLEHYQQQKT